MRTILLSVLAATCIALSQSAKADLAATLCQDEYRISDKQLCQGVLIGTIDSLAGLGFYCPDGATSYGHIIDAWWRLLRKKPDLKQRVTVVTMKMAIASLNLECKR